MDCVVHPSHDATHASFGHLLEVPLGFLLVFTVDEFFGCLLDARFDHGLESQVFMRLERHTNFRLGLMIKPESIMR